MQESTRMSASVHTSPFIHIKTPMRKVEGFVTVTQIIKEHGKIYQDVIIRRHNLVTDAGRQALTNQLAGSSVVTGGSFIQYLVLGEAGGATGQSTTYDASSDNSQTMGGVAGLTVEASNIALGRERFRQVYAPTSEITFPSTGITVFSKVVKGNAFTTAAGVSPNTKFIIMKEGGLVFNNGAAGYNIWTGSGLGYGTLFNRIIFIPTSSAISQAGLYFQPATLDAGGNPISAEISNRIEFEVRF